MIIILLYVNTIEKLSVIDRINSLDEVLIASSAT